MPYVYIVRCRDGTLYTGWTENLEKRTGAHNEGRGARYTRGRRPVVLVYSEELRSRSEAMRREREIKKMPRAARLKLTGRGDVEISRTNDGKLPEP